MKVQPPSAPAIAAARGVLAAADVCKPSDIQIEAIAARCGAMVLYGPLTTARAQIVRTGKHAVVCVDETSRYTPRGRFTIAHELAHHILHALIDHFQQCTGTEGKRSAAARWIETEANQFSAELLMPAALVALLCGSARPTLDDVERIMFTFNTSIEASAIRFVELAPSACAVVLSKDGLVRWCPESTAFPGAIERGTVIHPRSAAALAARRSRGADLAPREVPSEAWGGKPGSALLEHAIHLAPEIGTLSWITAA